MLNEAEVTMESHLFACPQWQSFFTQNSDTYTTFRNTWLLIRRQRPVVPCPDRCPLPGKRMSKDTRAKILSVYFRPWTLVQRTATDTVPYLPHLSRARSMLLQPTPEHLNKSHDDGQTNEITTESICDNVRQPEEISINNSVKVGEANQEDCDPQKRSNIRKAWKEYSRNVLPHAKMQLQNFMLACLAEGKTHAEEDEEQGHRRGTSLYCKLSVKEIREALDFQAKKAMKSVGANGNDQNSKVTTNKRVFASAEIALKLAAETAHGCNTMTTSKLQLLKNHYTEEA